MLWQRRCTGLGWGVLLQAGQRYAGSGREESIQSNIQGHHLGNQSIGLGTEQVTVAMRMRRTLLLQLFTAKGYLV